MDLKNALGQAVDSLNLLNNPFYRAWSCGQLSWNGLRTYAEEYGAFIALLEEGWLSQNDPETAQEEREHLQLWKSFARSLGTRVGTPRVPEVQDLVATARQLFAERAPAMGALYAFEVQQPATAKSKLDGLRSFYELPETAQLYFRAHQQNDHETEKLFERMSGLEPEEQARSVGACKRMCRALWDALTGIYHREPSRRSDTA